MAEFESLPELRLPLVTWRRQRTRISDIVIDPEIYEALGFRWQWFYGSEADRPRKQAFDKLLVMHTYSHIFSMDRDFLIASLLSTYGGTIWPICCPSSHLVEGAVAYFRDGMGTDATTLGPSDSADPVQWRASSLLGEALAAYFEALMVGHALETYRGPKATAHRVTELLWAITSPRAGIRIRER
ncbi:hypothetical protein LTR95_018067 [Oleoguttula sp. CCFEE 5521]